MTANIFKIRDVPPNSTGVCWSVSWPGYGVIKKPDNFKTMWDLAWATGAFSVSLAMGSGETYTINDVGHWHNDIMLSHAFETIKRHEGLTGVGFVYQEEAEHFVDAAEKHITWKLLSSEF